MAAPSVWLTVELGLTQTTSSFILGTVHPPATNLGSSTEFLTDGYAWADVTADVEEGSLSWARGATRSQGPWFRAEAGRASFTLENGAGDTYNPLNTTGPYSLGGVSMLRPGIPCRIRLAGSSASGTLYTTLWRGWVDTWQPTSIADRWSSVQVTATDAVERLQAANPPAQASPVGAGDNAGARINRILDNVGWPVDMRDIDLTGTITMQASTMAQAAWTEMLLTADSAAGFLYIAADGRVTYTERSSISPSPIFSLDHSSTTNDIAEEIPFSYDRQQVYNQISLARAGGTVQYVEDPISSADAQNGKRSYGRSDLICETDAQVQDLAQYLLFYYGTLKYRVEQFTLPLLWGDNTYATFDFAWLYATWFEMTDRVSISQPQPNGSSISQQGLVRGIAWNVGVNNTTNVTISLQQTPTATDPFVINTSLLGGSKILAPF